MIEYSLKINLNKLNQDSTDLVLAFWTIKNAPTLDYFIIIKVCALDNYKTIFLLLKEYLDYENSRLLKNQSDSISKMLKIPN